MKAKTALLRSSKRKITLPAEPATKRAGPRTRGPERQEPVKPRNKWEQFLYDQLGDSPQNRYLFVSDEYLDELFLSSGVPRSQLARRRKEYDDDQNTWVDENGKGKLWGGGCTLSCFSNEGRLMDCAVQMKPKEGGPEKIQYVHIPDSANIAVRFFDGDMVKDRCFMFDFFDTVKRKAVNSPRSWAVHLGAAPGNMTLAFGGRVRSWEENTGVKRKDLRPGEERFNVPEGSVCQLVRPGKEPFWFSAPKRDFPMVPEGIHVAQPTDA